MGNANNVDALLEAAVLLRDFTQIKIVLIGDGALRSKHEKFICDNGLDNVRIFNKVSRYAVFQAYNLFDVCYIGWGDYKMYEYGTSANKIAEYMSAGRPILQSYSGKHDIVADTQCGITVRANCPLSIANAIKKLFETDDDEMRRMAENALSKAHEIFDYDKITSILEKDIRGLVSRKIT